MKNTKTTDFKINKPVDIDWDDLGKLFRDAEYVVWKTSNYMVQMLWDFSNINYSYKERVGESLKFKDLNLGKNSVQADVSRMMREKFPNIYAEIINGTTRNVENKFNQYYKEFLLGTSAIPTFKRKQPIPIKAKQTKVEERNGKLFIKTGLLSREGKQNLGLPTSIEMQVLAKGSAKVIFEKLLSGEYKLCDSSILRKRDGWYFSISHQHEIDESSQLNPNKIMGIDLGIVNSAYMAFNNDKWTRYNIEGNEIIEFKRRVEARRNSLLKQSKHCGEGRRGHGRATRIKPIQKLQHKVENFRKTTNHKYSKYIIDMAVKEGVGVIQMEDLSGINERDKFLKNWSYYDLQQKVEYKAKEKGIEVKYVDPKYTSQRCNQCGVINKENRKNQSTFECSCGHKANADFNAAKNISMENIEEIIKEQIEFQEKQTKHNLKYIAE